MAEKELKFDSQLKNYFWLPYARHYNPFEITIKLVCRAPSNNRVLSEKFWVSQVGFKLHSSIYFSDKSSNFISESTVHSCRSCYIDLLLIKMAVLAMFQEKLVSIQNSFYKLTALPQARHKTFFKSVFKKLALLDKVRFTS